ncbi:MAG: DUF1848 domain-containing protein [Coprothermobacterota bacterium]|nr:DUF1848 domain-containing protein [Coprothermobacterota bacterium]
MEKQWDNHAMKGLGTQAKIISASRRTDIPAFYAPWLMNRIRAGYCYFPNPLYPMKFHRVSLLKEDVLGFVFWTRHPAPLIPHLCELDQVGFVYYFQYTIVGYPRIIDPRSPSLDRAIRTFLALSAQVGYERVIWRYDPIFLNHDISIDWHRSNFLRIADAIGRDTRRLVVSVIDPYRKTQRRMGSTDKDLTYHPAAYDELLHWIAGEAAARDITVQTCAEASVHVPGIIQGSCVDAKLLYKLSGRPEPSKFRFHKQREGCLCHQSVDIGANNSCGFGCQYCYATSNHERAVDTVRYHNPAWSCITQHVQVDEHPAQIS